MAGRRLELTIVFSRAGSLALTVIAMLTILRLNIQFTPNNLVFYTLIGGAIQWGGYLLWRQVRWLYRGGEQPGNDNLLVLIACEWMVACITIGTACAAITANVFALQHHYCAAGAACVVYLVAAALTGAAGALAAVSALGMLWILGSRFRPAQAP